eukprot:6437163-Amphidinium_carterae.1
MSSDHAWHAAYSTVAIVAEGTPTRMRERLDIIVEWLSFHDGQDSCHDCCPSRLGDHSDPRWHLHLLRAMRTLRSSCGGYPWTTLTLQSVRASLCDVVVPVSRTLGLSRVTVCVWSNGGCLRCGCPSWKCSILCWHVQPASSSCHKVALRTTFQRVLASSWREKSVQDNQHFSCQVLETCYNLNSTYGADKGSARKILWLAVPCTHLRMGAIPAFKEEFNPNHWDYDPGLPASTDS